MGQSLNLRWDTDAVRTGERFAYYTEAACRVFNQLEPDLSEDRDEFSVSINYRESDDVAVTNLCSSKHDIRRTRRGIAQSHDEDFYLNYLVSGTSLYSQGNQSRSLSAGRFAILDNSQEFRIRHQSSAGIAALVVRLRRSEFPNLEFGQRLEFDIDFRNHRLMPLLRMNLAELAAVGKTISDEELAFLGKTIKTIISLISISGNAGASIVPAGGIWDAMIDEIDRRIGDPLFTLDQLADTFGVSVRYVQKIFAARDLTFSEYLRERRLSRAADLLIGLRRKEGIEAVAYSCGFFELSTFYRGFKRRFGLTPGEMRRGGRQSKP